MKNLETNKIAAAVLLAGVIAMVTGKISDILYHPDTDEKRGYSIEVAEPSEDGKAEKKEEISLAQLLQNASLEKGEKTFKKCVACHSIEQGGANKTGPNIYGMLNSDIAAKDDFSYSDALKEKNDKWTYENLYAFLQNPKAYAPGTKMSFLGLRKPQQAADMIVYLRSYGGNDIPLPVVEVTEPEIEADNPEESADSVDEEATNVDAAN